MKEEGKRIATKETRQKKSLYREGKWGHWRGGATRGKAFWETHRASASKGGGTGKVPKFATNCLYKNCEKSVQ